MSGQGTRVLIVEDEATVAEMLEAMLTNQGYRVVAVASRLDEARLLATSEQVDVATLDVNLAGQLSYPVALALHERAIPFVFATGYGKLDIPAELRDVPVVKKPFSIRQIVSALDTVLEHRKAGHGP